MPTDHPGRIGKLLEMCHNSKKNRTLESSLYGGSEHRDRLFGCTPRRANADFGIMTPRTNLLFREPKIECVLFTVGSNFW